MPSDALIREHIVKLLQGGEAHMTLLDAIKDFPQAHYNTIFPNGDYSSWHLLEHIRRTQADILDFITNQNYQELEWPDDYWPAKDQSASKKDWNETIKKYTADLEKLQQLASDPKIELSAKIPWGNGQTMIREFLLVADHTAYHVGEFAIMRQVMNTWIKKK